MNTCPLDLLKQECWLKALGLIYDTLYTLAVAVQEPLENGTRDRVLHWTKHWGEKKKNLFVMHVWKWPGVVTQHKLQYRAGRVKGHGAASSGRVPSEIL